jgi:hypothetical protein
MSAIRWRGVVTDSVHFMADEHRAFKAHMQTFVGDEVEVTVRRVRRQSPAKRGYYRAALVPAFRAYLEQQFRGLVEAFRDDYGSFTFDHAHDVLVRCVMQLPEDVERVSTSLEAMDDDEFEAFLFRVTGFLVSIDCPFEDAERDPVRRFERRARGHAA